MKKYLNLIKILIILGNLLVFVNFSFAQTSAVTTENASTPSCDSKGCTISNPLGVSTPQALIGKVINGVLGIVGSLALLMFIYGGFTWMTAAGASDKVQHGKDILIWATIGLVVIFSAYAMVKFVFSDILGSTSTTTMLSISRNA